MAEINHAARDHAILSASGSHRWMTCTASAFLELDYPDTTSDFAKEGTLAHELCELKLRRYFYPEETTKMKYTRAVNVLKKDELWNDEMEGYTEAYAEFVKTEACAYDSAPYLVVEKRLDLSAYIPDGFGTADCIMIGGDTLEVIDFKYGKSPDGRVDAANNTQMQIYALGAYEAYKMFYPISNVRMCIVQPRLPDGISTWDIPVEQLLQFGETVKAKAAEAMSGNGVYVPDPHACKYCRARYECRARADKNVEMAGFTKQLPPIITPEEVADYIQKGEDVAKWLDQLKEWALAECLAGREIPGYKAVEGRGSRAFTDQDAAFAKLEASGVDKALLWQYVPVTLAGAEKVVGKKRFEEILGDMVQKTPGKPALVKASDKRPAITNIMTAAQAFAEPI